MMMAGLIITMLAFAVLNRARGSQFYELANSTVLGRAISTFLMGVVAAFPFINDLLVFDLMLVWVWGSLMLWATPGWNKYWSAAIGNEIEYSRLWGLGMMTLRQLLAVPCIIGVAIIASNSGFTAYALLPLLFGLPYYIAGWIDPHYNIPFAEYTVGAMLGGAIFMAGAYGA
jgi:hypothetical protein